MSCCQSWRTFFLLETDTYSIFYIELDCFIKYSMHYFLLLHALKINNKIGKRRLVGLIPNYWSIMAWNWYQFFDFSTAEESHGKTRRSLLPVQTLCRKIFLPKLSEKTYEKTAQGSHASKKLTCDESWSGVSFLTVAPVIRIW